jgi:hypothetical protein|tara:strand:- start:1096 stop:1242 length:147 start_codon:yes stop_codon:yes gene_type:complete
MKSWHLISGAFIATAVLSFYNNDFKLSVGIIAYLVIAIIFYITNRNKK